MTSRMAPRVQPGVLDPEAGRCAIEWVKRCPNPMPGTESEIEIRQVFEAEDFGAEFTPELREQEEKLRSEIERQNK